MIGVNSALAPASRRRRRQPHPDLVRGAIPTVDRCLETSLHFWGCFGIPAGECGAVLAGVKAGALRVAFGQP